MNGQTINTDNPWQFSFEKLREAESNEVLFPFLSSFNRNLRRAMKLVVLHSQIEKNPQISGGELVDDILRASVVFAHATLEEFLRTLAIKLLPKAAERILDQIPLANSSTSGRAEKFLLGRLSKFKGKTIDEVIAQSILEYYEHISFNDVQEIAQLLENLGLDIDSVREHFPNLNALIRRRHQIVHRADQLHSPGSVNQNILKIDGPDVALWIVTIAAFVVSVLADAHSKNMLSNS
jgi:HEPN superfamily RiboL-PSP-like protein